MLGGVSVATTVSNNPATLSQDGLSTHPTHEVGASSGNRPSFGWLARLIDTREDVALLVLRLTLALVIFPHGAQKLFGWFGGYGFSATMAAFTEQMGIPGLIAFLVILTESVGALALAAGAFGRVAAAGIGAVMIGAVVTTHLPYGFFMNWSGTQGGEGFEFHLLALGIVAALILKGSGAASVDRWWTKERLAA
jgi:putative oxidoreductase